MLVAFALFSLFFVVLDFTFREDFEVLESEFDSFFSFIAEDLDLGWEPTPPDCFSVSIDVLDLLRLNRAGCAV